MRTLMCILFIAVCVESYVGRQQMQRMLRREMLRQSLQAEQSGQQKEAQNAHLISLEPHSVDQSERISNTSCDPKYGGFHARLNYPTFMQINSVMADVFNEQTAYVHIKPIECMQGLPVSGCVNVTNIHIRRYKQPQVMIVHPEMPNKIVISIKSFHIGVVADISGNVNLLLDTPVCGIVNCEFREVSLNVTIEIMEIDNHFAIQTDVSFVKIGNISLNVRNGGNFGALVNGTLNRAFAIALNQYITAKLNAISSRFVREKINSKLANFSTAVPVAEMIKMLAEFDQLNGGTETSTPTDTTPTYSPYVSTNGRDNKMHEMQKIETASGGISDFDSIIPEVSDETAVETLTQLLDLEEMKDQFEKSSSKYTLDSLLDVLTDVEMTQKILQKLEEMSSTNQTSNAPKILGSLLTASHALINRQERLPSYDYIPPVVRSPPKLQGSLMNLLSEVQTLQQLDTETNLYQAVDISNFPFDFLEQLLAALDFEKLNSVLLMLDNLHTFATSTDYSIDVEGEFIAHDHNEARFCPLPIPFPGCNNCMTEVILSDYSINSLLRQLHRSGFLSLHITPKMFDIGHLTREMCQTVFGVDDLGMCLGIFLPIFNEYVNRALTFDVKTLQPPQVLFSKGCATIDFNGEINVCVTKMDNCSEDQRSRSIEAQILTNVCLKWNANRLFGVAEIIMLRVFPRPLVFGMQPYVWEQLEIPVKVLATKVLNYFLENGIDANIPLPKHRAVAMNITQITLVKHGLHIGSDFTISRDFLKKILSNQQ